MTDQLVLQFTFYKKEYLICNPNTVLKTQNKNGAII